MLKKKIKMKKVFLVLALTFCSTYLFAQESKLYHPDANAVKEIADAVSKAKTEHKYVLIQEEETGVTGALNLQDLPKLIRK